VPASAVQDGPADGSVLTTVEGDAVSRTVVQRALSEGVPVVAGDAGPDDSESLLLSGMRSVLAAPVCVSGEPVSCFYVTHGQVGQLFGEEEVQLAEFIATLTGASLEHLAGSEARFRSLAQNSSDVLTLVDERGVVSHQSPAVTRVFGLPATWLVGREVVDWVHPADAARFTAALHKALEGVETRVECRVRHADGSFRHVETAVRDLRDEPMVKSVVLNTRDVTDRRRLEDELRERALHDALTGLPNRVLFLDRARHALERAARRRASFCVAFLDLDDFKSVNDTFGHAAGDELLQEVAQRLVGCVRPADTVARLGGDEFAVLLEDSTLADAQDVAERVLHATSMPVSLGGSEVVVHASIGITLADDPGETPDQLLAQADAAMYTAKERGKQRYDVFAPAMQAAMEARSRVRTELDRALTRGELALHYQPVVDLRTGSKTGVEALVRWQHPERGLLPPKDFIEHAEDSGHILGIGTWVLHTACRDALALPPTTRMSVNVSARQLQHPGLVAVVQDALTSSGLPAHRLVLEITETATVSGSPSEVEATIGRLTELRALGLAVALDDFGTGYSPLSYLRRYPVDVLKIDRSFVTGIVGAPEDQAIVRGVVEMAHALGMRALAEGVETEAQATLLTALGCDLGQGYLWMRPEPLEQVQAWFDA
jgi:diguanylate cyclase (GGDEF)-like protein/PAS domain S-box-containing protein